MGIGPPFSVIGGPVLAWTPPPQEESLSTWAWSLRPQIQRGRDALERGEVPPAPTSRAPSLCPAYPATPSASFDGICNRQ